MNKIYKVIWNATLCTWVAVSELAKGKTKSSKVTKIVGAATVAAMSIAPAMAQSQLPLDASGNLNIGDNNVVTTIDSYVIGANNEVLYRDTFVAGNLNKASARSFETVVLGTQNNVDGDRNVVLGAMNTTSGNRSTAIGMENNVSGYRSTAVGQNNTVTKMGLALGTSNSSEGELSVVIGHNSAALGNKTIAMGDNARAFGGEGAIALGAGSRAYNANDIALGSNSGSGTAKAIGTAGVTLNGTNYAFAGTTPIGTLSIGRAGSERTITNVAAGRVSATSTDGINGSQLHATNLALADLNDGAVKYDRKSDGSVNKDNITLEGAISTDGGVTDGTKITNLAQGAVNKGSTDAVNGSQLNSSAQSVGDLIGGGVTNTAGNVGGTFTANGTGYSTIAEAIEGETAAAKTEVEAGKNVTVTSSVGADGQSIYTVATKDDVSFNNVSVGGVQIDGSSNKITGLTDGTIAAGSKDAVTGNQLNAAADNFTTILGGNASNVGGTVTTNNIGGTGQNTIDDAIKNVSTAATKAKTEVEAGKNVTVTSSVGADGQSIYTVATKDDVSFNNVSVGGVQIDGSSNKITGLTDGTIAAGSKDAVTGNQLNSSAQSVGDLIGGGVTNTAGNVGGTFTANGTGYSTIAEAIEGETAAAKTEVEAGKNVTVTSSVGADGQSIYTVATKDDVSFNNVSVGGVQIDGSSNKITGLTDGTIAAGSKDAVTGNQLNAAADNFTTILGGNASNVGGTVTTNNIGGTGQNTIDDAIKNVSTAATKAKTEVEAGKNVTVTSSVGADGQSIYTVATKDDVSFNNVSVGGVQIDGSSNKITGLTDGTIAAGSKDAVTGNQLNSSAQSVGDLIGGGVTNTAGNVGGTFTANGTGYSTIAEAIEGETAAAKTEVEAGKNVTVTSSVGADGQSIYTVATADEVEFDKVTVGSVVVDAANNDITGLANTTLGAADFATAGRAATEEQLSSVSDSVADIIGGGVTNVGGAVTGPFTANGTDYNNIAEAIEGESAAAKTEVEEGKNISVTSTTGTDGQTIYTVATADEVEFDKVTVGSVVVDATNNDITGLANTTLGAADFATAGRAATEEQLSSVSDSVADIIGGGVTNVGGAVTGPFTANGTDYNNIAEAIEGESAAAKTEVEEGKNISVTSTTGTDGQTIYTVATADEVEFDKVTVGNTTITTDGLTIVGGPSITTAGINAGGKKVTNVADGEIAEDSTDAVNGSQLYALGDNITNIFGGNANYANNQIIWTNIGGTGKDTIDEAIQYVNNQATNANQGWKVITDSGTAATSTVKPGDIVNIKGDTASGVTVTNSGNDITVGLGDQITVGTGANAVSIDGNGGTIQVGDINIDGTTNTITAGKVSLNGDSGTVNGLTNITWNPADIVSGQAATEDQLKQVADNAAQAAAAAKSTVTEGENVTVTQSKNADGSTNYQVATKKDVTFDSVTSGSVSADKVIVGNVVIDQAGISAGGNKVSNLADGTISSTSKDAINGSQLHASNTNIYNYLGGGANYETNTGPTYNVGGGSHNNVGDALDALDDRDTQLDNKITNLGDQLQQAFYTTNERIDGVEKRANAGIAAAMALETAPYVAGKWTYAAATAYHGGENAVGVTLRKTADNGRWSLTGGIAAASEGDPSFRIGISGVID